MQHNQHIAELGPLMVRMGIRHVVVCPGSRNAPMIQLFTSDEAFQCHSIVDERSAGYVALGMARQLREPVVVLTTSGTAVLNLSPAVAEAWHQKIPLVVVTADRPLEKIPQFNNQWMDQEAPFYSFSKGFYQLLTVAHPEDLHRMRGHVERVVGEANTVPAGPVHLNAVMEEPLYDTLPAPVMPGGRGEAASEKEGQRPPAPLTVSPEKKILVLAGMGYPDELLLNILSRLVETRQVVVVAENIANLPGGSFITRPELILSGAGEEEKARLVPDLVVSFGGQVVSKRLKLFLQSIPGLDHMEITGDVAGFLEQLAGKDVSGPGFTNRYLSCWKALEERILAEAKNRLGQLPFSNLMAVNRIMDSIPSGTTLHLGNSSTIRYSQLVPVRKEVTYYSNRGTSGIDGTVSTAVGAAKVSTGMHLLVVGDLGYVYDSNALWNKDFPVNLKIVVINDGGGGIFRLLEGTGRMEFFEEFQVTHHPVSLELLTQAFGRSVQRAVSGEELEEKIRLLFDPGHNLSVVEVDTSGCENSRIFKDFLKINPSV